MAWTGDRQRSRRVDLSASLTSQLESGQWRPSPSTIWFVVGREAEGHGQD
jgi:hypothetical protein